MKNETHLPTSGALKAGGIWAVALIGLAMSSQPARAQAINGGTLSNLSFAITGNTRPPNEDNTAGYPTTIITRIWQDIEAASPRPAFAIATGNYMFANPAQVPGTQAAQLKVYLNARAQFSNILYPAMGEHECGAIADNCGTNPNLVNFVNMMLQPIGQSLPYYEVDFNGPQRAWTAKFVFVACNAWSPTQATWLSTALSKPTTYTFVVRNEGIGQTTAPCLSGTGSANSATIMSQHPYTLLIVGLPSTYQYLSGNKVVVVGNGGAPLSGSVNYGYVIARQQANGTILFTEYDYNTNIAQSSFTVGRHGRR